MTIANSEDVGIGTITPSEKLHIVGNLRVQGSTDCTLGNGSGATNCTSDERLKNDIKVIPNALEKIKSVKGVEFVWNDLARSPGRKDIGVIAQDIQKVFPTAVIENKEGYLSVDYAVLVAPLIETVKEIDNNLHMFKVMTEGIDTEQSRKIASLEKENKETQKRLKEVQDRLKIISKKYDKVQEQNFRMQEALCSIKQDLSFCQ